MVSTSTDQAVSGQGGYSPVNYPDRPVYNAPRPVDYKSILKLAAKHKLLPSQLDGVLAQVGMISQADRQGAMDQYAQDLFAYNDDVTRALNERQARMAGGKSAQDYELKREGLDLQRRKIDLDASKPAPYGQTEEGFKLALQNQRDIAEANKRPVPYGQTKEGFNAALEVRRQLGNNGGLAERKYNDELNVQRFMGQFGIFEDPQTGGITSEPMTAEEATNLRRQGQAAGLDVYIQKSKDKSGNEAYVVGSVVPGAGAGGGRVQWTSAEQNVSPEDAMAELKRRRAVSSKENKKQPESTQNTEDSAQQKVVQRGNRYYKVTEDGLVEMSTEEVKEWQSKSKASKLANSLISNFESQPTRGKITSTSKPSYRGY